MSYILDIDANFRIGYSLPSIETHYRDIWVIAKFLEKLGFPLADWFPPADTAENSLLNAAFTETGPSEAALAMARADKENHATDLRTLGVWNGKENDGSVTYTATYNIGYFPSGFNFSSKNTQQFSDFRNVVKLVEIIVRRWKPMVVQIAPGGYLAKSIFADRPGAGWMLYLPFIINSQQVPEAAQVINIMDDTGKKQLGTLLITVEEVFDVRNDGHIKLANAIETRLVDQDLLPTNSQFLERF